MAAYIIRRLLVMPVILVGVSLLIFGILQILGPVERSALYVRDVPRNDAAVEAIIRRYGLDDPFLVQYWRWLVGRTDPVTGDMVGGVLRGDLGFSRTGREPVIELLKRRLPVTAELAIWSMVPIIVIGVWLGVQAALHHNGIIDQVARVLPSWVIHSPPLSLACLCCSSFTHGWAGSRPAGSTSSIASKFLRPEFTQYTRMVTVDSLLNGRFDIFLNALRHLVLPVVTLSYLSWALLLKVTRSSMLEALRQDYVTTARAKGLAERTVINRHVLKNALIPVATVAGFTVAGLLNGVVITETIFNIPGLGSAAAAAAISLDVLTMLGYALFTAVLFIVVNLIVDIMYAILDPRVRLE
jgi:peptide/nickel transport system permease protein